MLRGSPLFIKLIIIIGATSLLSVAATKILNSNKGFRELLIDFIKSNQREEETQPAPKTNEKEKIRIAESGQTGLAYRKGDWEKYVIRPKYEIAYPYGQYGGEPGGMDHGAVNFNSYGSIIFNMTYGKSEFTKDEYRRFDEDRPVSRIIDSGLNFDREIRLHMEGEMGKRMTVYIDHDSGKEDNRYRMQYRALENDEVIREINAGEIDIAFEHSKYAVYDDSSSKGLGMDLTLRRNKLKVKAFGSVMQGEAEIEIFRGQSSPDNIKFAEYQYAKMVYYQLEPFTRYDGLTAPPAASADNYNTLITFTSNPPDPAGYSPRPVGIDNHGFELYMDDQNPYNNLNSIRLPAAVGGGYYDIMASGADYRINFSTGLITIIKTVPVNARICAVYTLRNGGTTSSDPSARTDVDIDKFFGRIFVFLKYGTQIDEDADRDFVLDDPEEDKNGDGKLNLDIYEVRSFYLLGQKHITENNFRLQFFRENKVLGKGEIELLGKFSMDYSEGTIMFYLREPFRKILGTGAPDIYSEQQPERVFLSSQYNIRADYFRESRSFQLKHPNIIPDSVRIKINGRVIPSSLFSIDHTSGFLEFTDPNNPTIGDETEIEIKYEYLPPGASPRTLVAGVRSDYAVNRSLNLGGTVLFTRETGTSTIPVIGDEPGQTLLLEADTSVKLTEGTLKKIMREISGNEIKSAPLEINGYAEYARSIRKINTFGKALIDDMEDGEEVTPISMSEKDWVLSSMPSMPSEIPPITQADRGEIYYKFYRDPSNPGTLRGPDFSPYSVLYSTKPGPYNVATGHIADSIQDTDTQKSLVFNFDLSGGDYIPVVSKKLSSEPVDFSGLQYVEIWYRSGGGAGEVDLYLDIGNINEDSDGDGKLDTEDANLNGFLDFDPGAGIDEDIGYSFNPDGEEATTVGSGPRLGRYTNGDGILNSEDLNNNGILDTAETIIRIPGDSTYPNDSSSPLVLDLGDTSWRKTRIYLDRTSAEYRQKRESLKSADSIRLFLKKRGGANTGIIYIDSIRFVSLNWTETAAGGGDEYSPDEFRATKIDTYSDSDYRAESYMLFSGGNYESLHGEMDSTEMKREKETALQIEYNFSAPDSGSVARKFQKAMDLRYYKTLNIWMNFRDYTEGDTITILIGSGEDDYLEYSFPMQNKGLWRELSLRLKGGSGGSIPVSSVSGSPDMKRMNFLKITVNGQGGGKLWINDVYTSGSETLKDSAYWYEGDVKFKRPLLYTNKGTPVLSDFSVKYIRKGHGAQFSTVGKTSEDISEEQNEIFSEVKVLPNWISNLDYVGENSRTDSLNEQVIEENRGGTEKRSLNFVSDYRSNIDAVPSIKIIYKQDGYNNKRNESISSYNIIRRTENVIYSPILVIDEKIGDFRLGSVSTTIMLDSFFKKEEITRECDDLSPEEGSTLFSPEEIENRQNSGANIILDYHNKYFSLKPSVDIRSQEIVKLSGKENLNDTKILGDVRSGFHVPFIYNRDFKFVRRDKKGNLDIGINEGGAISPVFKIELNYIDSGFRDYEESERGTSGQFTRAKDAASLISNRIYVPFSLSGSKRLGFVKNIALSYWRTLNLDEKEIPYEGEKTNAFDEEYGPGRIYDEFAGPCLDLYSYPPWHFFRGRDNYANGRDFAYKKHNRSLAFTDGSDAPGYNNTLRLVDSFSIGSILDFEKITVTPNAGLSQTSERQIIYGIPMEAVTFNMDVDTTTNLMQIFSFGFFRPNKTGAPYHSASLNIGFGFTRNMLITSNIEENSYVPRTGAAFKRDRAGMGINFEYEYKRRNKREYISLDFSERDRRDDIYVENMQSMKPFREIDKTYRFSCFYETDVKWLYDIFSRLYTLAAFPIFYLEYALLLNKYDYSETVSPEPYDQHLVTGRLTLDLHKNVQGGINGRWALEKFRNRDTGGVAREIRSYELGINFTLLF